MRHRTPRLAVVTTFAALGAFAALAAAAGCKSETFSSEPAPAQDAAPADAATSDVDAGAIVGGGEPPLASLIAWLSPSTIDDVGGGVTGWREALSGGPAGAAPPSSGCNAPKIDPAAPGGRAIAFEDGTCLQFADDPPGTGCGGIVSHLSTPAGASLFVAAHLGAQPAKVTAGGFPFLSFGDVGGSISGAVEFGRDALSQSITFESCTPQSQCSTAYATDVLDDSGFHVYDVVVHGSGGGGATVGVEVYVDGVLANAGTRTVLPIADAQRLACFVAKSAIGGGTFVGSLGEILIYGAALDDNTRARAEAFLNARWR